MGGGFLIKPGHGQCRREGHMRSHLRVIRHLTLLCSRLTAHRFRSSGAGTAEPDILHLQDLRQKIERSDRSALSSISSRPMQYSGARDLAGYTPVPPESFLPGCMVLAKKDIDDILRAETRDDL